MGPSNELTYYNDRVMYNKDKDKDKDKDAMLLGNEGNYNDRDCSAAGSSVSTVGKIIGLIRLTQQQLKNQLNISQAQRSQTKEYLRKEDKVLFTAVVSGAIH